MNTEFDYTKVLGIVMETGFICRRYPVKDPSDICHQREARCSVCNQHYNLRGKTNGAFVVVCHREGFDHIWGPDGIYDQPKCSHCELAIQTSYIEASMDKDMLYKDTAGRAAVIYPRGRLLFCGSHCFCAWSDTTIDVNAGRAYQDIREQVMAGPCFELSREEVEPATSTIENRLHAVGAEVSKRMGFTYRDVLSVTAKKDDDGPAQIIIIQYVKTQEEAVESLERLVGMGKE